MPEDLGYIEGRLEGEKLIIENHCFQTPQFRKMHLELAKAGSGIDILHCVMFPHLRYNVPMFGCDLVAGRGQISAAIVDLSPIDLPPTVTGASQDPVRARLPDSYISALDPWLDHHHQFSHPRDLPDWGWIFSPYCLFIRPTQAEEEDRFLEIVSAYLSLHCDLTNQTDPSANPDHIYAGQSRYCHQQQQNDRTRRVLEKAFGSEWAERYMTTVLFDLPPSP